MHSDKFDNPAVERGQLEKASRNKAVFVSFIVSLLQL